MKYMMLLNQDNGFIEIMMQDGDTVEKIVLDFKERSYPIYFEEDFFKLPGILKEKNFSSKVLIITDTNVDNHYGEQLQHLLSGQGFICNKFVFQAGEQNKNLDTISLIYDECLKHRLDRKSVIIALGGGVTGDIAGFAASTFMRGIKFVQVPTSLLAQVDSSVGGKVGVDYQGSKNIIGSFYQPSLVYMNLKVLQTLPKREFISGMAEVIKHAVIYDYDFFEYLEQNIDSILKLDTNTLKYVVWKNCIIKSQVVQQDETEQELRAILNFGHTIGHALESVLDFSLLHGECVSVGMAAAAFIAYSNNLLAYNDYERILSLLQRFGLPVKVKDIDCNEVYEEMLRDKKQEKNKLKFILPVRIGRVIQTTEVTKENIFSALEHVT